MLVLGAVGPIIAAARRRGIQSRKHLLIGGHMSDGHQEGQDGPNSLEETTDASVTMQSDDSKADAMAILVMFTAAVAFCVFFISGWSFDL